MYDVYSVIVNDQTLPARKMRSMAEVQTATNRYLNSPVCVCVYAVADNGQEVFRQFAPDWEQRMADYKQCIASK